MATHYSECASGKIEIGLAIFRAFVDKYHYDDCRYRLMVHSSCSFAGFFVLRLLK